MNWYATGGQASEQLFAKNTPEFLYWVRKNLYELADFAADKLSQSEFFDQSLPMEERLRRLELCGDQLTQERNQTNHAMFAIMEYRFFGRLYNDIRFRGDGTAEDLERIHGKTRRENAEIECAGNDTTLAEFANERYLYL